jgi:hypothetical protein
MLIITPYNLDPDLRQDDGKARSNRHTTINPLTSKGSIMASTASVGGLSTALRGLNSGLQIVSGAGRLLGRGETARAKDQADTTALERATTAAAQERSRIALDASIAERQRQESLRRAVAKARVEAAGKGRPSSDQGSGEAVLSGLYAATATERDEDAARDALRIAAVNSDLALAQRQNLLEREQKRSKAVLLSRVGSYGDDVTGIAQGIIGFGR